MALRLHADGVDGQDAEVGLLAPVLRCPHSLRSFFGVREANLSSWEEIDLLLVEIRHLLQKQVISVVQPHDRERGFYSAYLVVPKRTGVFSHLNRCVACKTVRMLTVKQLLEMVQLGHQRLKTATFTSRWPQKLRVFIQKQVGTWVISQTGKGIQISRQRQVKKGEQWSKTHTRNTKVRLELSHKGKEDLRGRQQDSQLSQAHTQTINTGCYQT